MSYKDSMFMRQSALLFCTMALAGVGCSTPPDGTGGDVAIAAEAEATSTIDDDPAVAQALTAADFKAPFGGVTARTGTFDAVVICMNANAKGSEPIASRADIVNFFWGNDGQESVSGWFSQNSQGKFTLGSTAILGCDPPYIQAPMQGDWYWDTGNHAQRWLHAVQSVDPFFDFHSHDKNNDGHLSSDELAVVVVFPGGPSGTYRPRAIGAAVDGVAAQLTFDIVDTYVRSAPTTQLRKANVGLLAHELSHGVAATADMYEYTTKINDVPVFLSSAHPDQFSIMSRWNEAPHLDPFHKVKLGWIEPDVISLAPEWLSRQLTLKPAAAGTPVKIIHDPARTTKEYFMIENRSGTDIGALNYDNWIVRQGPVVYHVVEDLAVAQATAEPGYDPSNWKLHGLNDWGRTVVRLEDFCGSSDPVNNPNMNMNRPIKLKWADGTHAHMRITCKGPVTGGQSVLFDNTRPRLTGNVAHKTQVHYGLPFTLIDGTFTATMTGTNDADLYIRRGGQPTLETYDCVSRGGTSAETCTLSTPGDYHVMVYGYSSATASYDLRLDYTGN